MVKKVFIKDDENSHGNGIFEIKDEISAKDAWELFFGRFYSPEIPEHIKKDITFAPDIRVFEPRGNRSSKNNPADLSEYPQIDLDRTLHSDDFDDFLNGHTIKIDAQYELSQKEFEIVKQAIADGNWNAAIFNNEKHIFYALWLFKLNQITRQQMATVLARHEAAKISETEYAIDAYRILDDQGNFTEEAKNILFPILAKSYTAKFTDAHKERFRLLMNTAPKSEQVFFLSKDVGCNIIKNRPSLGYAMSELGAWYQTEKDNVNYDVHLSFAAIEAQQIAVHGVYHACANRAILGILTKDDIERGIESNNRGTAVSIGIESAGITMPIENLHGFAESAVPIVTAHDIYHAKRHGVIADEFHRAMSHLKQIIRQQTGIEWSSLLWEIVDRDFRTYNGLNFKVNGDNSIAFNRLIFGDLKNYMFTHSAEWKDKIICLSENSQLSSEGLLILWDMINNKQTWEKAYTVNIDTIDSIPGVIYYNYHSPIAEVKQFCKLVGADRVDPRIINLKYHAYCSVQTQNKAKHFNKINESINAVTQDLLNDKNFRFVKIKKDKKNQKRYCIVLKYRDQIFDKSNIKDFIWRYSYKNKLGAIMGVNFNHTVPDLNQDIKKFDEKLFYQGANDSLAKNDLDNLRGFQNLALSAKIFCLENWYDKVKESKKYRRKHPVFDSVFSYFKNPLTAHQRQHVAILQNKMREVIEEYINESQVSSENKKKFLDAIKSSPLINCKLAGFYLQIEEQKSEMRAELNAMNIA